MTQSRLDRDASDRLIHNGAGIERLLEIMARLRDPETGCPWDIEQSFATIAPYTLEEAFEVADAIDRQAWPDLKGELGDLLFQTVYHARMAAEAGHFTFAEVVETISDKMVSRHPHVFGDQSRDKTAEQQTQDWEAQKAAERGASRTLDGIAQTLPALTRALKLRTAPPASASTGPRPAKSSTSSPKKRARWSRPATRFPTTISARKSAISSSSWPTSPAT